LVDGIVRLIEVLRVGGALMLLAVVLGFDGAFEAASTRPSN
jgi:hypothetical protein